jgi:hypothetical protein
LAAAAAAAFAPELRSSDAFCPQPPVRTNAPQSKKVDARMNPS